MNNTEQIPHFIVDYPYEIVYRKNSTSYPVKPHTHNALEIYFTMTDLPDVLLNDTVSSVSNGSLIIIPPHCVHQLFNQKLTTYERYIVTINSNWINSVLYNDPQLMPYNTFSAAPEIIPLSKEKVSVLCNYLNMHINSSFESGLAKYADFFKLLAIIDSYIADASHNESIKKLSISQSQKRINEIIAYINRHITEPISMDKIADEFHLNKDYLGRLFKEHTHATVSHYISVQKVGLAQNMLAKGHTISEVQEALSFSSYAYFFKFFKKMTGVSPSHFHNTTNM